MSDETPVIEGLEPAEDVEAHLLKESVGAGLAAAAIFAGSSQAGLYPEPPAPGTADALAELALIPQDTARTTQQAKPQAAKAKKGKKAKQSGVRGGGGAHKPQ